MGCYGDAHPGDTLGADLVVLFFSSTRRHTIFSRDWSSDVCSSDLGCGKARLFSFPYHAWTYDLAGELMGIPDERCFPDVRSERASLVELPLCEKHGLVWVIPTSDRKRGV